MAGQVVLMSWFYDVLNFSVVGKDASRRSGLRRNARVCNTIATDHQLFIAMVGVATEYSHTKM
jgi:hypothetical protein